MALREHFNVVRTVFLSNFFLLIFLLPLHGDGLFESGRFFIEEEHEIKKGNRATVGVASGLDVIEAILMIDCRKGVFWVVGGERVICDTRFVSFTETSTCFPISGLRHLTTSKTPEASISSALSRDTKLFENTAPSIYCVRPTYRKDLVDSEAIYLATRENGAIFESGLVGAEVVIVVARKHYSLQLTCKE